MFRRLMSEFGEWMDAFMSGIPGGIGRSARAGWMRCTLARLGAAPKFETGVTVIGGKNIFVGDRFWMRRGGLLHSHEGKIQIGNNVFCNTNVYIDSPGQGEVIIGDNVLIGPNTVLQPTDHDFKDKSRPIRDQGDVVGRIVLGEDVWIGANVVILRGVTVGDHAIVAAGAVVTKDVSPWSVVGGVPARLLYER